MISEGHIKRSDIRKPRSDDEIAEDARDEILWYSGNDPRKIYEIILRAIWNSKHQDRETGERTPKIP